MAVVQSLGYKIYINEASALGEVLEAMQPSKTFVLVDEHTEQNCLVYILEHLSPEAVILQIDSGSSIKTSIRLPFCGKACFTMVPIAMLC